MNKTVRDQVADKATKYTDADACEPHLREPAIEWLREQQDATNFVLAMQEALRDRGRLSLAQLRGVLNCWRHQLQTKETSDIQLGKELHRGTYTVLFDDGKPHLTIRLKLYREDSRFMPGKLIAGYLYGPDNRRDYRSFGHVDGEVVHIWQKYRDNGRLVDALHVLAGNPLKAAMAFGITSGRCGVCGRKLTVPESILAGIGPVCASNM